MSLSLATAMVIILVVIAHASAQLGAQTAPANLDDLVQQAAIIVRGHVVSAVIEPHPQFSNIQTVVVSMSVARTLKGEPSRNFTFRQFVWDPRDAADAAGYRKGGELLLFLNPNSEYGLTSPVGLEQGRFRVSRDAQGKGFAANGRANFALFNEVFARASSRGVHFSPGAASMLSGRQMPEGLRKPQAGQRAQAKVPLESLEDAITALAGSPR